MSKLIFLGGTCGGNNWRQDFISNLVKSGVKEDQIFNPVVPEWNDAAQVAEENAKANCSHMIYFISDPKEEGNPVSAYSLLEAAMGLYDKPETTVVIFDHDAVANNKHIAKVFKQSEKILKKRFPNANIFGSLAEAVAFLAPGF